MTPLRGVEYRVRWQRRGWVHQQQRIVNTRPAVERLVAKLTAGGRWDLAPLILLAVDERPTGCWKPSPTVTIPRRRAS